MPTSESPSNVKMASTTDPRPSKEMYVNYPSYPRAMILDPVLPHKQTFIILHGRGSFAEKFAPPLLEMRTGRNETIQTVFPHAKIVFPTASRNRATVYKNSFTHQWFNCWHLEDYKKRQGMMRPGLHQSCNYIHFLLKGEIEIVGAENVILWGMSQGCATSLSSLLAWDGEPFAAVVGMCGWLPFGNLVEEVSANSSSQFATGESHGEDGDFFARSDDEDDPFARSEGEVASEESSLQASALSFFREEIDMDHKKGMICQQIPVFLGNGMEDPKVSIEMGREARRCLDLLGVDVKMREYDGLGHWYSEHMLSDIFQFIKQNLNSTKQFLVRT
ncbi:766909d2-4d1f-4c1f-96ba-260b638f9be0 [Sclerotinia trifoliorum]|uniref:766909d2-4d1f-4c1f-96ba-260b638f9be0 n=1 Tax=Sclerotinia trifoliorum TaxID=28548 RepID=A0A8H2VPC9_9HELO|nr:766909d2-4d1f-4c1f-96ba-260b638f9be0 [Sclerotinia trifoliorum]